jgi:hypothetical protein
MGPSGFNEAPCLCCLPLGALVLCFLDGHYPALKVPQLFVNGLDATYRCLLCTKFQLLFRTYDLKFMHGVQ